jgi:shikimate dehydrogenase
MRRNPDGSWHGDMLDGLVEASVRELVIYDADESRVARFLDLLADLGDGRVAAGPPDPTGCDLVFNATPMGMEDGEPLPVDPGMLTSSMFVGDVIAGHGVTLFIEAAQAAGCKTANGGQTVEAVQDLMADFMLGE